MSRIKNIAIAFDQLCNAVLGGYPEERFSSRCWRLRYYHPYTVLRAVIDGLFFFDPHHCESSYLNQLNRKYSAPGE